MTAYWHKLMIPYSIVWQSIVCTSEQWDVACSMQTYHCYSQPHKAFNSKPVSYYSWRDGQAELTRVVGYIPTYQDGLPIHPGIYTHDSRSRNHHHFRCWFFITYTSGMKISCAENERDWKRCTRWIRRGGHYYYTSYCCQR